MRFAPLAVTLIGAASPLLGQSPERPGDDLVGPWGARTVSGPAIRGELSLERVGDRWVARIAGHEFTAPVTADSIRLQVPDDLGEFRGRVPRSGSLRGFWIQPAGAGPAYASPVTLRSVGVSAWRGSVVPLDERFDLFLMIRRDPDGALRGSFHNPEARWNGGASSFRISRDRDHILLTDPVTGKERFRQPYDSGQRRIAMDFGSPIALAPLAPEATVGLVARSPGLAEYRYRMPIHRADGWPTARAASVGLNEAPLAALVQRLAATDPIRDSAPLVHSILIARHGKLVLEEYFFGFTADRPHDLRSAGKTLTAIMVGAAIDAGALRGIDAAADTGRDQSQPPITVGHLLTHSSGLACDDNNDASPGNEERVQRQRQQPDWYRYFLDLPMVAPPGTTYAYCSAGFNLAGGLVRTATRTWLPEFFDRALARPLGIERYHWNLMPSGEAYTAGGAHLLPRDLLKFGQVFLDGGVWRGRRVVSRGWVNRSTAHQIATPDGGSDGLGWHRYTLRVGDREYQEFEASGNGGQFLVVIPGLDLTMVVTAGNYNQYRIWKKFREFAVVGVRP